MNQQVIFGNSVLSNDVPETAEPFVCYPGQSFSGKRMFAADRTILSKHVLLLGGAGCGKTNAFCYTIEAARNQMTADDVAIIFDTKGEFYDMYYRPGDYVIGNSSRFRKISNTWNIFEEILCDGNDPSDITMNAREISAAFFADRGSESQPFFCDAARDVFCGILLHFIRMAEYDPGKWKARLNNKCLTEAFAAYKTEDYVKIFRHYKDMNYMLTYIGDGSSNQALGVFGELNSMLSEYFVGIMADHIPGKSLSLRKAVRERGAKAVFIEYDLSVGETLTPVYKLLVDQALKEALGRSGRGETVSRNSKVFLFVDEFKLLPKLQHIDDALNFGRGLGLSVMAGIQSIAQLYDNYGEERGAVIAGGFGSMFAFHVNDDTSRKYISGRFGPNMIAYSYTNTARNTLVNNEREGNAVEEWDQMKLGVGQAVIGLGENPPFLFQFSEYHKG